MTVDYAIVAVVFFLLGKFSEKFFSSYVSEKGKNLATKEDVGDITREVESIRADLSGKLATHGFRYQQEFEVLAELSHQLFDLASACAQLRPVLDYVDPTKTKEEIAEERLTRLHEARYALHLTRERKRPFYPGDIYEHLRAIDKVAHTESVQYRYFLQSNTGLGKDATFMGAWAQQQANAEEIRKLVDAAGASIRLRVTSFDKII
ncbi:hypothetical protein [Stenotrophomonas rhizophila]|uniref:hypothetical protein n=1 Tax=Stenotrophomonas rhizophila TaxID=216778 RepID=UPI003AF9778D